MKKDSVCLFLLLLCLSGCIDDHREELEVKTAIYKVAVIMPESQQNRWERTANWVLENITKAQQELPKNVKLDLEWVDEETDGWEDYLKQVCADDSYVAVIGPLFSANAEKAAQICYAPQKCMILPIATSTEFQRI